MRRSVNNRPTVAAVLLASRDSAYPRFASPSATMALWRVLPVLAAVVLYCCTVTVHGQSYVPEPVPFNRCPPGQRLLSIGSSDASNITLFSDGANLIPRTGGYVAITPITLHDQRAFGVTLYQMALALNDNRFLQDELGQPARVRLGIYLYQEPENNTEWFDLAVLIAQTDLITVRRRRHTPADA